MIAPKDKHNKYGGYDYRTAEGIKKSAKEFMPPGATLVCSDTPAIMDGQLILLTKATLTFKEGFVSADGFALHAYTKKGMDPAQISGACSSYAKKYALCNLFAIDDDDHEIDAQKPLDHFDEALSALDGAETIESLSAVWKANKIFHNNTKFEEAKNKRKTELEREE